MPWKRKPTTFSVTVREQYTYLARAAALRLLRGVMNRSPVDTGRFRGNWQVSENAPAAGSLDFVRPFTTTLSAGISAIPDDMINKSVYITNNLPYAERLENGWSLQAPYGMVRLTMLETQQWLDKQ